MTLEVLQEVQRQLQEQLRLKLLEPVGERPVIKHCNAIELMGALQLIAQLVQQETIAVQSPPGATGPVI